MRRAKPAEISAGNEAEERVMRGAKTVYVAV